MRMGLQDKCIVENKGQRTIQTTEKENAFETREGNLRWE